MWSQCPGCGTLYTITQEHLGRQIQCKKCGHRFVIEAVSSETPPPAALPQSDPQSSSGTGQASQMIQVACQHCGTANQMPPGVACNCGRCGQPLPVSAPSDQPWPGQATSQATAPSQLNAQARSVVTPNFDVGQILGSVFSILFKKPALLFGLGILAGLPSALFLGKHAKTIEAAEEMAEFAGEGELIITDYLYDLAGIVDYMSCLFLGAAVAYIVFRVLRQETVTAGQAYNFSRVRILPLVGAAILVGLATGLGLVLLVIPGVVLGVLLSMTIPACAIEGLGAVDSLKRSVELTKGYRRPIFGFYLVGGILIIGVQCLLDASLDIVSSFVWYNIFYTLLNAFPLAFGIVMTVMAYFKLREIKEGVTLDGLAGTFELNQGQSIVTGGDQKTKAGATVLSGIVLLGVFGWGHGWFDRNKDPVSLLNGTWAVEGQAHSIAFEMSKDYKGAGKYIILKDGKTPLVTSEFMVLQCQGRENCAELYFADEMNSDILQVTFQSKNEATVHDPETGGTEKIVRR